MPCYTINTKRLAKLKEKWASVAALFPYALYLDGAATKLVKLSDDYTVIEWEYATETFSQYAKVTADASGVYVHSANKIVKINPDGSEVWSIAHATAYDEPRVVNFNGAVYYAEGYSGYAVSNTITAVDSAGGALWSETLVTGGGTNVDIYAMEAKGDFLYIAAYNYGTNTDFVAKWDVSGATPTTAWEMTTTNHTFTGIAVDDNGDVYLTDFDASLKKVDGATGSTTWVWQVALGNVGRGVTFADFVYVTSGGTTTAVMRKVDPTDGSVVWTSTALAFGSRAYFENVLGTTNGIYVFDPADGTATNTILTGSIIASLDK